MELFTKAKDAFNTVFTKKPTAFAPSANLTAAPSTSNSVLAGASLDIPMWVWVALPLAAAAFFFRKKLTGIFGKKRGLSYRNRR